MNNYRKVITQFFSETEKGQFENVLKFYSPNAMIHSPLYGSQEYTRFYKGLIADTKSMKVKVKNIFEDAEHSNLVASLQDFTWILKNGESITVEGVNIFEFTPNTEKIKSIKFIYDTSKVRLLLEKLHAKR